MGGAPFSLIALNLNRSQDAIVQRATARKWFVLTQTIKKKKPVVWRSIDQNFKGLQEESSQILSPS